MTPQALLLLLLAAAVAVAVASAAPANGAANDLLPKYGLPKGLIPDSVSSYTFDEATGDFEIHLAGTCYVRFGDHLVYYEKTLRGCLSKGRITGLAGIQAKKPSSGSPSPASSRTPRRAPSSSRSASSPRSSPPRSSTGCPSAAPAPARSSAASPGSSRSLACSP
uniref:Uncharacterized protein n=1 Tax=Triticum urartu TaxID=4572 RepID=A0A8R7U473_TRIUA